jgi:hypothetical protein
LGAGGAIGGSPVVAGRGGGVALHLVEVAPYGVEPVVRPELVVERVEQPQARLGQWTIATLDRLPR